MKALTREEVRNVIEGKGAAERVPLAYAFWIYGNIFGNDMEAREKWLSQYPNDIDTFGLLMPDLVNAPADDPDYRWTGMDMVIDERKGLDNRVLIEDWESPEAEAFFEHFPSAEYRLVISDDGVVGI